jgi:hypothetical protein
MFLRRWREGAARRYWPLTIRWLGNLSPIASRTSKVGFADQIVGRRKPGEVGHGL